MPSGKSRPGKQFGYQGHVQDSFRSSSKPGTKRPDNVASQSTGLELVTAKLCSRVPAILFWSAPPCRRFRPPRLAAARRAKSRQQPKRGQVGPLQKSKTTFKTNKRRRPPNHQSVENRQRQNSRRPQAARLFYQPPENH